MFDFDPFDMDMDGDVDGVDFLGFDYLMRHVLGYDEDDDDDARTARYSVTDDDEQEEYDVRDDEEEPDTWYDDETD
jgi:hypothetical protein